MHYATAERKAHLQHGLTHDPFKAIVAPRPIGWITTCSVDGVLNLAPYSFFNAVSDQPPMVMFASSARKDSLTNIEATGEFTCSIASQPLVDQMNLSSAAVAHDVDEYDLTQLATAPSLVVGPPRVAASPAAIECRLWQTLRLPDATSGLEQTVIFGAVVAIYIDEQFVKDGILDTAAMRPLARMGYMDYAVVTAENSFTLNRPRATADRRSATVVPGPWDGVYR